MIRIDVDLAHLLLVGLLWCGVAPALVLTYSKVTKTRKPLYLLSLPVAITMAYLYLGEWLSREFGLRLLGPNSGIVVRSVLFLVVLLFYLEIYIDRLESKARAELALLLETQAIEKAERERKHDSE